MILRLLQQTNTCSKSVTEIQEEGMKYDRS